MATRRLKLKTMFNARDLGGYPTKDGKVTKFNVFIRSEFPAELPEEDIQYLKDYGITASIDFRSIWEVEEEPSSLTDVFSFYHRPVNDSPKPPDLRIIMSRPMGASMTPHYQKMVDEGAAWVKGVLELAAAEKGGLLYHCAGGKDRTGIMSCILLSIAGVSREDIAADYCLTEVYAKPRKKMVPPEGMPPEAKNDFAKAPASTMLELLDHFDARYGGVMGYLSQIGVKDETIAQIREKFLVEE